MFRQDPAGLGTAWNANGKSLTGHAGVGTAASRGELFKYRRASMSSRSPIGHETALLDLLAGRLTMSFANILTQPLARRAN